MVKVVPSQLQTTGDAGEQGQEGHGAPSVVGKWGWSEGRGRKMWTWTRPSDSATCPA